MVGVETELFSRPWQLSLSLYPLFHVTQVIVAEQMLCLQKAQSLASQVKKLKQKGWERLWTAVATCDGQYWACWMDQWPNAG